MESRVAVRILHVWMNSNSQARCDDVSYHVSSGMDSKVEQTSTFVIIEDEGV